MYGILLVPTYQGIGIMDCDFDIFQETLQAKKRKSLQL